MVVMVNRKNWGFWEVWLRLGLVVEIGGVCDGMGWDGLWVLGCSRERF